jgi:hypothetical protein
MTDFDPEIKDILRQAVEASDLEKIKEILDALEMAEHPEMVKVEFTRTQYADLEFARKNLGQQDIAAVLRIMVDGFMPNYKKSVRETAKAKARG